MSKRSGFTLIEASMVVAIVGLLSAVAVPSFQKARTRSMNHAMEVNVRLLNSAVQQWAMETLSLDGAQIGGGITNYIQGGLERLDVGSFHVVATNVYSQTVGHTFTVEDLY